MVIQMNSYLIWVFLKFPNSQKAATYLSMPQSAVTNSSMLQPCEFVPAIQKWLEQTQTAATYSSMLQLAVANCKLLQPAATNSSMSQLFVNLGT